MTTHNLIGILETKYANFMIILTIISYKIIQYFIKILKIIIRNQNIIIIKNILIIFITKKTHILSYYFTLLSLNIQLENSIILVNFTFNYNCLL